MVVAMREVDEVGAALRSGTVEVVRLEGAVADVEVYRSSVYLYVLASPTPVVKT